MFDEQKTGYTPSDDQILEEGPGISRSDNLVVDGNLSIPVEAPGGNSELADGSPMKISDLISN